MEDTHKFGDHHSMVRLKEGQIVCNIKGVEEEGIFRGNLPTEAKLSDRYLFLPINKVKSK